MTGVGGEGVGDADGIAIEILGLTNILFIEDERVGAAAAPVSAVVGPRRRPAYWHGRCR